MNQAARGATALAAGNYDEAAKEYSAAIAINPRAADYYIKRSTAFQRSTPPKFDEALKDAEVAVVLARERARRELIAQAQMRRAIILFSMERYGDAGLVLGFVRKLDEKEKTLQIWENKVAAKLKGLPEDDEKAQVTVKEQPEVEIPSPSAPASSAVSTAEASKSTTPQPPKPVEQTPIGKIKHDWYQTNDKITFTLLAKGVPKDKAIIDIQPHSLNISFPTASESTYEYSLDPLYAAINPADSTYNITSTKIEVTLKKAIPGHKWHSLEGTDAPPAPSTDSTSPSAAAVKQAVLSAPPVDKPPAYPTSSRTGPKDWDKISKSISLKPSKPSPSSTSADAPAAEEDYDDDQDDEDGDPAAAFFKKLYKGADPDTRRAMMKSYQESNGTVLSTNWSEVGAKTVETQPPDGMEERKWG